MIEVLKADLAYIWEQWEDPRARHSTDWILYRALHLCKIARSYDLSEETVLECLSPYHVDKTTYYNCCLLLDAEHHAKQLKEAAEHAAKAYEIMRLRLTDSNLHFSQCKELYNPQLLGE